MAGEDPEGFLRVMAAPLSAARRGEPLPGVPFSLEAVANAFVMLGLLPEVRAEEILAEYRGELEAKGFRVGVLTGEVSLSSKATGRSVAIPAHWGARLEAGRDPVMARVWTPQEFQAVINRTDVP